MAPVQFGNYQILRKIGAGGMAQVFEAQRVGLEGFSRRVALKCILPEMTRDTRFVEMFVNEARLGSQLHHPNIVEIQDFNKVNEIYYIAMEFVEGVDLGEILARFREQERDFPPGLIIEVMLQTLEGLAYAHSAITDDGHEMNLVHRDIKPSNLLLTRRGTVKIADFGIAKAATNAYQTQTAELTKGSLAYMAPEQITRESALSPASDIFSLGAVLFELLSLRALFDGENMPSIMFKVAQVEIGRDLTELEEYYPQFIPILKKALARDVADRYSGAGEMALDLRKLKDQFLPGPTIQEIVAEFIKPHPNDDEEESISEQTATLLGLTSNPFATVAGHGGAGPALIGTHPHSGTIAGRSPGFSSVPSMHGSAADPVIDSQPSLSVTHGSPARASWTPYILGGLALVIVLIGLGYAIISGTQPSPSVLVVKSTPPGAEILVNGELRTFVNEGQVKTLMTPARLILPQGGAATVELRLEGFEPYVTRLTYQAGKELNLTQNLKEVPRLGGLQIVSTPPGATIELDGQVLTEKTPVRIEKLQAGRSYKIRLTLDGYLAAEQLAEVAVNSVAAFSAVLSPVPRQTVGTTPSSSGSTTTPARTPRPEKAGDDPGASAPPPEPAAKGPPGMLVVSAVPPDCVVYIDGEKKGPTPISASVPSGTHRVKLVRFDGSVAKEFSVTVGPGAEVTRVWDMDNKQFLSD